MKKMTMETIEMAMTRTMIPSPQALKESHCYSEIIHNGPLRRQPQKKPGAKLPPMHPRYLHLTGEQAKLRPFIQIWYDHLSWF